MTWWQVAHGPAHCSAPPHVGMAGFKESGGNAPGLGTVSMRRPLCVVWLSPLFAWALCFCLCSVMLSCPRRWLDGPSAVCLWSTWPDLQAEKVFWSYSFPCSSTSGGSSHPWACPQPPGEAEVPVRGGTSRCHGLSRLVPR